MEVIVKKKHLARIDQLSRLEGNNNDESQLSQQQCSTVSKKEKRCKRLLL